MRIAVLYFSLSGNNRLLARHLAGRLGAELAEVKDPRRFKKLRLIGDLRHDRRPPVAPIPLNAAEFDHVIFVAPLFDSNIAFPMKTVLSTWGRNVAAYSYVTLCGYYRQAQRDKVLAQLESLTGKPAAHISELVVGDLVPEQDRKKIWIVSNKKVREDELGHFAEKLSEIVGWFEPEGASGRPQSA